jgi:hypothetical protein
MQEQLEHLRLHLALGKYYMYKNTAYIYTIISVCQSLGETDC